MTLRGLFTGPRDSATTEGTSVPQAAEGTSAAQEKQATTDDGTDATAEATENTTEDAPPAHRTHPEWEQGTSAPRLFERLEGWRPGTFPPPIENDPWQVMQERLKTHEELWNAVRVWEERQRRLDDTATAIHREAARREKQYAEEDAARRLERRMAKAAEKQHQERVEAAQGLAVAHGFKLVIDGDRARLTAPRGHMALTRMFPWQEEPALIATPHGILIPGVGETLGAVEEFLEGWPTVLSEAARWKAKPTRNTAQRRD